MIKTKSLINLVLVSIILGSMSSQVMASTSSVENIIPNVFKIISYDYNSSFGTYKAETYGSAVLVDDNRVITNAHVVLQVNGKPYENYEICKSNGLKEVPTCFSILKLIRYDIKNDLALLEIENDNNLGDPVTFGSEDLDVGMDINVVGFPANGGDSVTVTKGSIAGYEKGFYKIDANLDGGNSGGGGFDNDGKLIGIPTFVSEGYTTLGYIIPIDVVTDFLEGKTGTKFTKSPSKTFSSYIDTLYKYNDGGMIVNAKFSTPEVSDYNLNVIYATEKKDKGFYNYVLINNNESIEIIIDTAQISAKMTAKELANLTLYRIKKAGGNGYILTKKKNNSIIWYLVYDTDNGLYSYIQGNSKNNSIITIDVIDVTEDGAPKSDLRDAMSFVENVVTKTSYEKQKAIPLPQLTLSDIKDFYFLKSYSENGLEVVFYPSNKRFIGNIGYSKLLVDSDGIGDVEDNLSELKEYLEKIYESQGYTVTYKSVERNSQNAYILIMEIISENDDTVTVANIIVKDSGNYLLSTIGFDLYGTKDSSYIRNYIKNIKITNPIK